MELVQTTVPPEGDTGFRTLVSAQAGRAANSATMFVRLDSEADLDAAALRLEEVLGPIETDGWDATVQQASGPGGTSNLALVVSGPDLDSVETGTATIIGAIEGIDGLGTVTSDLVAAAPQVEIRVDTGRAAAAGVTAAQVGGVVRGALTPIPVTTIRPDDADDPVPVILRLDPEAVDSADALGRLPVGPGVTLADVAEIEEQNVRATISRVGGTPSSTVTGEIVGENTGAISAAVQAELDRLDDEGLLPAGVSVSVGGVSQQQAEAFGGLFVAMGVAVALVYLMLVLAFNSLITPFVLLFSLPLATIGAFPALLLTGSADRDQRPHRLPHAHRHRGHQRDRAARPRRAAPRGRRAAEGGPHPGRPHPRATDPHDRARHDPRARAAGGGAQRGLDHRGRARDGGHRRAAELDVPHPGRGAGGLFAGRGPASAVAQRMSESMLPSLGPRGEGWVVGQGLLLVAVAALGLLDLRDLPPQSTAAWATLVLGLAVMGGGLIIGARALRDLGANLTAMPRPRDDAQFVAVGIYRFIRHPMYAALITAALGWVLVTMSVPAAVATAALAAWLDLKSRREESWLSGRYPEYEAYRRRTHRFIPGAY